MEGRADQWRAVLINGGPHESMEGRTINGGPYDQWRAAVLINGGRRTDQWRAAVLINGGPPY